MVSAPSDDAFLLLPLPAPFFFVLMQTTTYITGLITARTDR
jgi:hypothetical protein